jgi:uncharacterized protein YqjF (DUF2071 family)
VSYAHSVEAAARQGEAIKETGHRPWPLPEAPWIMGQTWERLAFLHWRVTEQALRGVVHPSIPIDTFDGSAWLSVTPFTVTGLHLRATPPPPLAGNFHEINVRTYATIDGKPGIYFFSLDASSRLAVQAARTAYRVPYFHARMDLDARGTLTTYSSVRDQPDGPPAAFEAEYEPTGPVYHAAPGSLDHFLTERYCLYTLDEDQRVHRGEIHHPPWPLQPAAARIARNTMASPYGIELPSEPIHPIVQYAHRQDVLFWPLEPLQTGG